MELEIAKPATSTSTRRLIVVLVLFILTAGFVILHSQRANEDSIQTLSTRYMEEVATGAWSSVESYLGVVPRCMELIQTQDWSSSKDFDQDLERLYRRLLLANQEIQAFGWGKPNGDFMMVRRMPDDTFSAKTVHRKGDVAVSKWQHENDAWGDQEGYDDRTEPADEAYDPRLRDWYRQAVEAGSLIWSDPYIFYSDRRPGISSGLPLYIDNEFRGVVASDLRIDELSEMLQAEPMLDRRRLAILTEEGGIIAHPGLAAEGISLSQEVPEAEGSQLVLRRLADSPDQVMAQAFLERKLNHEDADAPFTFIYADESWVARFDNFRVHPTRSWIVGVLDREDTVMDSLRHQHRITLGVALACLVLSIGLAVLVLARIQRERLSRETTKLDRERKLNDQLRELDRIKNEFLANTSHELRTPLFGIAGLAEALSDREKSLPDQSKKDLELIISSCRRLTSLVNDVLDFSKLKNHELRLEADPVDVRSITDVVLTLTTPLVGSKNIRLINRVPHDLPQIRADEGRVQQVLHNLIGNAVEFTQDGWVQVDAEQSGDMVVVAVRDTGPGIPEADQQRIFKSFEQGAGSLKREHGGTGLGLAVSRQLVEQHGGHLWLESEPGNGATFRFSMPIWRPEISPETQFMAQESSILDYSLSDLELMIADEKGASNPDESAGSGAQEGLPGQATLNDIEDPIHVPILAEAPENDGKGSDGNTTRLLIVDDEPINLRVLASYLATGPYQVTSATSGAEALELLKAQAVDVVILDIMMPKMSGYEVCRHIRRQWPLEELPVLFLTAKTQVSDRIAGFAEGANDYLIKPVERAEFLARIGKEVQLLRQHRGLSQEARTLSGMLPICPSCKRVRDDAGYWERIERYLTVHTKAQFSHGICPDCILELYGDIPGIASTFSN